MANKARKDDRQEDHDLIKTYIKNVRKIPLLSAEEEKMLFKKIKKGCKASKKKIIESNLRLVVSIVTAKYVSFLNFSDLIQAGNIGLITAVRKFKLEKGCRFSTYATYWIRKEVSKEIFNIGDMIRLPVNVHAELSDYERKKRKISSELNADFSSYEVAKKIKMTDKKISHLQQIEKSRKLVWLDASADDKSATLGDFVEDGNSTLPCYQTMVSQSVMNIMNASSGQLSERDREIIKMLYGFSGKDYTLKEICKKYRLARETLRLIESRALKVMREHI
ncbi:MAG: sigma-70 family RNA polymerase sigma factor [Patescibacteria group bacterium]